MYGLWEYISWDDIFATEPSFRSYPRLWFPVINDITALKCTMRTSGTRQTCIRNSVKPNLQLISLSMLHSTISGCPKFGIAAHGQNDEGLTRRLTPPGYSRCRILSLPRNIRVPLLSPKATRYLEAAEVNTFICSHNTVETAMTSNESAPRSSSSRHGPVCKVPAPKSQNAQDNANAGAGSASLAKTDSKEGAVIKKRGWNAVAPVPSRQK